MVEILRSELHRTLVLMGCRDVRELDRSWLIPMDPRLRSEKTVVRSVAPEVHTRKTFTLARIT